MRRSSIVFVACALACARTGLYDFGSDAESNAGAGGSLASGGSSTGGITVQPDECSTALDCPPGEDLCSPPSCVIDDRDGAKRCIAAPIECDDGDFCTIDSCEPGTGLCRFEAPEDADGDGFVREAPRGAPPSCGGEDCDDTDPTIFPGAREVCDGEDNDCNGGIDEGIERTNVLRAPLPIVPPEIDRAAHGGLVWNGRSYAVSYNTTSGTKRSFFKLITEAGLDASAEVQVSGINADAYAGPIEWSGSSFFTAFSDARQGGNYEIYATRFDEAGVKLEDDLRVTDAPDFSLNPAIVWTGEEYVVAWDDRRERMSNGVSQIYARRFTERGDPIGEEKRVSAPDWSEYPALAVGETTIALAYTTLGFDGVSRVRVRLLDRNLNSIFEGVELPGSEFANAPTIVFSGDRYVVAWGQTLDRSTPGSTIRVAYVDEPRGSAFAGQGIDTGFAFLRQPSLLSLGAGESFLVVAGAQFDGAYDLYAAILDPASLLPLQVHRLTNTEPLSLFPYAARGPGGSIGIVFDEHDETAPTSRRPHFMAVGCTQGVDLGRSGGGI